VSEGYDYEPHPPIANSFSIEYFPPKVEDILKTLRASMSIGGKTAAIVQGVDEQQTLILM
jgi:hypothetical protein